MNNPIESKPQTFDELLEWLVSVEDDGMIIINNIDCIHNDKMERQWNAVTETGKVCTWIMPCSGKHREIH